MTAPPAIGTASTPRPGITLGIAAVATLGTVAVVLAAVKATEIVLIVDPGELVRSGYAATKTISNTAAAISLGTAVIVAVAVPAHKPSHRSLFRLLRTAATVWALAGFAASVFTFANISGVPLTQAGTTAFWSQFAFYSTGIELGQAWTVTIAAAALIAVCAMVARSPGHAAALACIGALALIPLAQQGHAAGSTSHNLAVVSILMHVLFASIWIGGLVALVWLRRTLSGPLLSVVLRRYSTLALAAFFAVSLSGFVSASIRISDPVALIATSYGLIVLGKVIVLVVVGTLGAIFRKWLLPKVEAGRPRLFWALIGTEVSFMGLASGLAGVLARTAPPGAEQEIFDTGPVTTAESLTGSTFPAPPTGITLIQGQPDPFWLLVVIFSAAAYLGAVRTLGLRGTSWPWKRTAVFIAGLLLILWVTCGPLSIRTTYLLSAYTATLVALLAAGACLAQGHSITLARATLRPRSDGTLGPREWAAVLLRHPLRVLTNSPLSAGVVVLAIVAMATIPAGMRWAVTEPLGRLVVLAAVTLAGTVAGAAFRTALTARRPGGTVTVAVFTAGALAGTALTWLGPPVMVDWFTAMNPGGSSAADADQRFASTTFFASSTAIAGTALAFTLRALSPHSTPAPLNPENSPS